MSLYTLTSTEQLPVIKQPARLIIQESTDVGLLSRLGETTVEDVIKRLANDHLAFVAYIDNKPAAFGWMARGKVSVGELNHSFVLPMQHRYLWNFRTLADYRGLGIYPALLQYIVRYEGTRAKQFWIIHAPENTSSLKGIVKAGFRYVGKLYTAADGTAVLEAGTQAETYRHTLEYMDIRFSNETPASCWNCGSPYLKKRNPECCCIKAGQNCTRNDMIAAAS